MHSIQYYHYMYVQVFFEVHEFFVSVLVIGGPLCVHSTNGGCNIASYLTDSTSQSLHTQPCPGQAPTGNTVTLPAQVEPPQEDSLVTDIRKASNEANSLADHLQDIKNNMVNVPIL